MAAKIGITVTKFLKLKATISKRDKETDELKSQAVELELKIIKLLELEKLVRFDSRTGSVKINKSFVGNCDDKRKLLKYAISKKQMQLVTINLSQPAYREMVEDGVKLPFIKKFNKKKLNIGRKKNV